jgi:hypothetical protein
MYIARGEGFEFLCRSEDLDLSCTRNVLFFVNSFAMDRVNKMIAVVIIVLD